MNKLKPRLYRYTPIGNCIEPTVFPKYTFFSNESKCQLVLFAAFDENQTTHHRDSKMRTTLFSPFIERLNSVFGFSDKQTNRLTTFIG